jgi:hypothetical protein
MLVSFLISPRWGSYVLDLPAAVEEVEVEVEPEVILEVNLEAEEAEVEEAADLFVLGPSSFVFLRRRGQGLARSDGMDGRDGSRSVGQ